MTMKKIFSMAVLCAMMAASCDKYDDSAIKEAQSSLEDKVDQLDQKFSAELASLKEIVEGKVTVTSCVEDDLAYTIVLSDGKTVTVMKDVSGEECLFSKVDKVDDTLVLTLADGFTEYVIPFVEDTQMKFFAASGKQYFTAGETKDIYVEMVGVDNFTVTEKPDGWKAVLTEGLLKVTAPASDGETSGVIKMLGVGSDPAIAQVYVAIGTAPCSITIADDKTITITTSSVSCFYGASRLEDFDSKALAKELASVTNPMLSRYPYVIAGSSASMPLEDMMEEVVVGETYVVWALPMSSGASEIMYESISSISVEHQVMTSTFEDAQFSVSVKGTDIYYLVPMTGEDMTVANVISDLNGSYAATYDRYKHNSTFRGLLSQVVESPMAGQEYTILVLPVKLGEFLKGDAVTFKVKLPGYVRGGSASVSLEELERQFKSISVKVTATSGPYKVIVRALSDEEYVTGGYSSDAALLDFLVGYQPVEYKESYTYTASSLASATKYWIVAAAIDKDGNIGSPVRLEAATRTVENSDVVLSIGDFVPSISNTVIPVTASGKLAKVRYFLLTSDAGGYWYNAYLTDDQAAIDALAYETVEFTEVAMQGTETGIVVESLVFGTSYIFRAIGIDAEGKITNIIKSDFQPSVGKVVAFSDPKWSEMKPEIKTSFFSNIMYLTVTFPQGCKSYVATRMSSEEYDAQMPGAPRLKTDYVVGHYDALQFTSNISSYNTKWYVSVKPYVLIAWEDESGWYEPLVFDTLTGTVLNQ